MECGRRFLSFVVIAIVVIIPPFVNNGGPGGLLFLFLSFFVEGLLISKILSGNYPRVTIGS